MTTETLTFQRIAIKKKDGYDGFMYVHCWPTGYQQLIFDTKEQAEKYKQHLATKK